MKIVSIIVPVFHVELYLKKCIESIITQSYPHIEVILIDDGGDDKCPDICDDYVKSDTRVKCIHKLNEGQSMARKAGLEASTGDYVMYVDADDWLEPDTVKICIDTIENNNADIVLFGYKRIYENKIFNTSLFDEDKIFEGENVRFLHRRMVGLINQELTSVESADRFSPMWGKLYRRQSAFAGIFISERTVGSSEDALYNLGVLEKCHRCVYINKFFYNYRKTDQNTTTNKYRKNLVEQWKVLFDYFDQYIMKNNCGEDYKKALQNRIALGMLGIGLNELNSEKSFFEKSNCLREVLKQPQWENAYENLSFEFMPFKWKIFFGLCKYKQTELLLVMLWVISKLKSRLAK